MDLEHNFEAITFDRREDGLFNVTLPSAIVSALKEEHEKAQQYMFQGDGSGLPFLADLAHSCVFDPVKFFEWIHQQGPERCYILQRVLWIGTSEIMLRLKQDQDSKIAAQN